MQGIVVAARTKRGEGGKGEGPKGGAERFTDEDEWGFIERLRFGFGSGEGV